MRIAVFGADGQLGSDVTGVAAALGHEPIGITHAEVDLRDQTAERALKRAAAEVVINAAAMNHVERCEREPELALTVNALGAGNLARAAANAGLPVVHVSTDYVFDGEKGEPYVEDDLPAPLNFYGISKLAGEYFVRAGNSRSFIVRTSALYGVNRCRSKPQDNFVRAMLRLGRERGSVTVVNDELVTPTYTADLAVQLVRLAETQQYGMYHATTQGSCSWFDFARAIFDCAGIAVEVKPVSAVRRDSTLRRPRNSVLDNAALRRIGLDLMPDWRESL